ncbi:MAG: hypothetical protein IKP58_01145 [Victivallales bacterium]|nr:hypothetical protein [Victivallales bacterium]
MESNTLNETCNVLLLLKNHIVGGHIPQEMAVKLAQYIVMPLLEDGSPMQIAGETENAIPEARPAKENWTSSRKNDANLPITAGQLSCLERNSDKEQLEICERFQVQALNELTKEQASLAIKASMDAKEARKKNYQ